MSWGLWVAREVVPAAGRAALLIFGEGAEVDEGSSPSAPLLAPSASCGNPPGPALGFSWLGRPWSLFLLDEAFS
jgi:hypothetical protein